MSNPRAYLPGTTYKIDRRAVMRMFLLKPSRATNEIVNYCAAVAADATRVEIHAMTALSDHTYLVCTDVDVRMLEFLRIMQTSAPRCVITGLAACDAVGHLLWRPGRRHQLQERLAQRGLRRQ